MVAYSVVCYLDCLSKPDKLGEQSAIIYLWIHYLGSICEGNKAKAQDVVVVH